MSSEIKKIKLSIEKEFIEKSIDLAIDYSEIAIDQILEGEILSEIPIVKTVYNAVKTGMAFKERHFVKKILSFFREFHSGELY